jgi:GNAT superfamily N-acetyltransferase
VPFNQAIAIRKATHADVERLVHLNHAAYPDLIEQGVVFNEEQLHAHVDRFATGQLVAEIEGTIVGAISSLIPPAAINPLVQHTWVGITDGGMFSRHDLSGRTLYLADVYVDPSAWGRGVSQVLYAALRGVCQELKLDHVVAGGRLWGYCEVADRMTAREPHPFLVPTPSSVRPPRLGGGDRLTGAGSIPRPDTPPETTNVMRSVVDTDSGST